MASDLKFLLCVCITIWPLLVDEIGGDERQKPVTCDFEDDLCGWEAVNCGKVSSAYHWMRGDDLNGTPDRSSGPPNDHTYSAAGQNVGHFVYAASRDLKLYDEDSACFLSQSFSTASKSEFSFWYYMNGRNSGTLSLELLVRGGKTQVIWQTDGPHRTGWNLDSVDIPAGSDLKLQFKSTIKFRFGADVALDDIILGTQKPVDRITRPTPSIRKRTTEKSPFYTQTTGDTDVLMTSTTQTTTEILTCTDDITGLPGCDFDSFWCGFSHNIWIDSSGLEWVRGHRIPSSSGGQGGRQTTQPESRKGSFVYLDTYSKNIAIGSKAAFKGHIRNEKVEAVCVEFLYATDGVVPSTIAIYNEISAGRHQVTDLLIGEVKDNTHGRWRKAKFESCVQKNSYISFQSQKLSDSSLVALDDIKISRSTMQCQTTTSTVYPQTTSTNKIEPAPPTTPLLSCDFNKDLCAFRNNGSKQYTDFQRTSNLTVPVGVPTNTTVLKGDGSFIYIGSDTQGTKGYLYANISNTANACVEFDYMVAGIGYPTLTVFGTVGGTSTHLSPTLSSYPSHKWQRISFNASLQANSQIVFFGQTTGKDYIALDNIKIIGYPCLNATRSPTAKTTTTATTPSLIVSTTTPKTQSPTSPTTTTTITTSTTISTVMTTDTRAPGSSYRQDTNQTMHSDISTQSYSVTPGSQRSSTRMQSQDSTGIPSTNDGLTSSDHVTRDVLVTDTYAYGTFTSGPMVSVTTKHDESKQRGEKGFRFDFDGRMHGWKQLDDNDLHWQYGYKTQDGQYKPAPTTEKGRFLLLSSTTNSSKDVLAAKITSPFIQSNASHCMILYYQGKRSFVRIYVDDVLKTNITLDKSSRSIEWKVFQMPIRGSNETFQLSIEGKIKTDGDSFLILEKVVFTQAECQIASVTSRPTKSADTTKTTPTSKANSGNLGQMDSTVSPVTAMVTTSVKKEKGSGSSNSLSKEGKIAIIAVASTTGVFLLLIVLIMALKRRKRVNDERSAFINDDTAHDNDDTAGVPLKRINYQMFEVSSEGSNSNLNAEL